MAAPLKTKPISGLAASAALCIAALALTGCAAEAPEGQAEGSPLNKYMYAVWGSQEQDNSSFYKQQVKIEDQIAKCMAKEGFDYKPNLLSEEYLAAPAMESEDGLEMGTVAYAEAHGYRIFDSMFGPESKGDGTADEGEVDANAEYVSSLTDTEQQAYYEALNGNPVQEDSMEDLEDGEFPQIDWSKMGCYGAAQNDARGNAGLARDDPEYQELFEQMDKIYVETNDNGEEPIINEDVRKLNQKWADCVSKAGFDVQSPGQAQTMMMQESGKLTMGVDAAGAMTYREPSTEETEAFHAKEIKVAVADVKCQEKTHYEEERQKIVYGLEQKFIDEHKTKLDAMLVKYSSKKKEK
ncbi:hypothetical protein G7068_03960 [Leucobacter viscericola]|uniref:Uncharacterized protein n=1 Tax=Leucobacter viscericola TaxID=2714935 RepID=A0A6G7XCX5_9MICO|nr:hypothetical protein [Leucobacter viscericola]QIK62460.1 hypothetical protein G7068_03960 [Leucobacter viscericola]